MSAECRRGLARFFRRGPDEFTALESDNRSGTQDRGIWPCRLRSPAHGKSADFPRVPPADHAGPIHQSVKKAR
jgi:hypothetical protein